MSTSTPSALPEANLELVKSGLYDRVRARLQANEMERFQDRPQDREAALSRLNPSTLLVGVFQMPPLTPREGTPTIMLAIRETATGKNDGIFLQILSDEERQALWGDVEPADFAALCEESALRHIAHYEDLLQSTPSDRLDLDYNGYYTYRGFYQLELLRAQETLEWVRRQDPSKIKEAIQYF